MSEKVCVIIPYFQRTPGILGRALKSIADQRGVEHIYTLVIDDSSPIPADGEIPEGFPSEALRILHQPNAGPAIARNTGLDHVPADSDFVAFLDSDDAWTPTHLRNALDALGDEFDFYFANYTEPDSQQDEFSNHRRLNLAEHPRLTRGSNCYRYAGDMVDQVITANVLETSTVVFRWEPYKELRFRKDFRAAFEDALFWIAAAQIGRGFCFSTNVECRYGRGISIWRSSSDLGSRGRMSRMLDQRRYYLELERHHGQVPERLAFIRTKLARTRQGIVADLLHHLRRGKQPDWSALRRYLKLDPMLPLLALPIAVRIFADWARRDEARESTSP